jgi:hypothetical protein
MYNQINTSQLTKLYGNLKALNFPLSHCTVSITSQCNTGAVSSRECISLSQTVKIQQFTVNQTISELQLISGLLFSLSQCTVAVAVSGQCWGSKLERACQFDTPPQLLLPVCSCYSLCAPRVRSGFLFTFKLLVDDVVASPSGSLCQPCTYAVT